jgi:SHS2 domain-containing protein
MKKFKIIDDLTSDVMFEAWGSSLEEVFTNAAHALMSVVCQEDKVEAESAIEVEVKGKNTGDLMFHWLQELIAQVDVEEMFFKKFEILEISETHLKAKLWGEDADPSKGETVVKSVTNHKFSFEKTPEGYKTTATLDI